MSMVPDWGYGSYTEATYLASGSRRMPSQGLVRQLSKGKVNNALMTKDPAVRPLGKTDEKSRCIAFQTAGCWRPGGIKGWRMDLFRKNEILSGEDGGATRPRSPS